MKLERISYKNESIIVKIFSSKIYKNIKCSISNDYVRVSKPRYVSKRRALEFVYKNIEWVYDMYMKNKIKSQSLKNLDSVYIYGKKLEIEEKIINKKVSKLTLLDDKILYEYSSNLDNENKASTFNTLLKKLLKNETRKILNDRLKFWSKEMDESYNRVAIKSQKTVWGSAVKEKRNLNFNMKIAMLPEDVADYIIVHELCHFKQANHSKKFWDLVEIYIKDYKKKIKYLKDNYACFDII